MSQAEEERERDKEKRKKYVEELIFADTLFM